MKFLRSRVPYRERAPFLAIQLGPFDYVRDHRHPRGQWCLWLFGRRWQFAGLKDRLV